MSDILLNNLWKKGVEFLGAKYAILAGAMSWISDHVLVSAISNGGGFGVLACGILSPQELRQEILKTQELTRNAFGVNLITLHKEINVLLEICKETNVSHVILAGGIPSKENLTYLNQAHIKVICFAATLKIAEHLIKIGADALILEGSEAGGHIGPVSTTILLQEILPFIKDKVPVFIAGGIGHGSMIASVLQQGAAGVQIGTHFVCSQECKAHSNFKNQFIKARSRDATISPQMDERLPIIPVRALENQATKEFILKQKEMLEKLEKKEICLEDAILNVETFWAGSLRRAVLDGDIQRGSLMAGQSVGWIKEELPAKDILENFVRQTQEALLHYKNI